MQRTLTLPERLLKGKIQLQKKMPFFGYLLVKLPLKAIGKGMRGPIGTDGWVIAYDKESEFLQKASDDDLEFILCHEVLHCALDHVKGNRIGGRDRTLWNIAADFVVNGILCSSGLHKPQGALHNSEFATKCVEEVYELLNKQIKQGKGKGGGKGSGDQDDKSDSGGGGSNDGRSQIGDMKTLDAHYDPGSQTGRDGEGKPRPSDAEMTKHRDEWARAFAAAAEHAKQIGRLPAGIARLVEELLTRTAPWTVHLRRFLETVAGYDDFTYARPSKRTWAVGYYTPERRADKIEVAIAIDTSGSISQSVLVDFLSEIEGFRNQFRRAHCTIYPIDAEVYEAYEVEEDDDLVEKSSDYLKGGGGTDFRPLFTMFEEAERPPKCLIFLTDGYASYPSPEEEPDYFVLWLVIAPLESHNTPPFGEIVEIQSSGAEDDY